MSLRESFKRSSFSDWCLVAFTLALAFLGYFQFKTMTSQLNVMQNDERAWIEIKRGDDPGEVTSGQKVRWALRPANIGKTPAKNIQMRLAVELLPRLQKANLRCVEPSYTKFCSLTSIISGIMYPNAGLDLPTLPAPLLAEQGGDRLITAAEADAWNSGNEYIAVYGTIEYDDVFQTHHWAKFCYWHSPPGYDFQTYSAQECTEYNSVDNN